MTGTFIPFHSAIAQQGGKWEFTLNGSATRFPESKARILEKNDSFPKRLRQVAVFALDNPDEVAFGTAASALPSAPMCSRQRWCGLRRASAMRGFRTSRPCSATGCGSAARPMKSGWKPCPARLGREGGNAILSGVVAAAGGVASIRLRPRSRAMPSTTPCKMLARADTIYLLAQRRSFPVTTYLAYMFGKLKVQSAAGLLAVRRGDGTDGVRRRTGTGRSLFSFRLMPR